MAMNTDPVEVARAYVVEASRALEAVELRFDSETLLEQLPAAYFARLLHLCGAAIDVAQSAPGAAPGIIMRSAVETWIDCCYHLYCGIEAAINGLERSVRERTKFARSEAVSATQRRQIKVERDALDAMVRDGIEEGYLPPQFQPNGTLSLDDRLCLAIDAKGAGNDYRAAYEIVYRGLSTLDAHATLALDTHLVADNEVLARLVVEPQIQFEAGPLLLLTAYLAVGAGNDMFRILKADDERVEAAAQAVVRAMSALHASIGGDAIS